MLKMLLKRLFSIIPAATLILSAVPAMAATSNPPTGDGSNPALILGILGVSLVVIVVIIVMTVKKNKH